MIELRHGVVDIGLITPIYVKGGAHLIRIQSGFYAGVDAIEAAGRALPLPRGRQSAVRARTARGWTCWRCRAAACRDSSRATGRCARSRTCKGMRIRAPTELLPVLRELGVDPVNMPMGEVYSALAKGVIDGVIAPDDTFKSLHFAEVAHYFAALTVPRGAYPARAMGVSRWRRLTDAQRARPARGRRRVGGGAGARRIAARWSKGRSWRASPAS